MCITNGPAKLNGTKIISFRLENGNNYLAYSNSVKNLSDGKNAMILPVPGKVKPEWLYDTTKYSTYLNQISEQTKMSEAYQPGVIFRSRSLSKSLFGIDSLSFIEVGQYKVLLTEDVSVLKQALSSNGISLSKEIEEFFSGHYKDVTYVACMFDKGVDVSAQPIALEYTPNDKREIFFPTMDSHDGKAPKEGDYAKLDHDIIVQTDTEYGSVVNFDNKNDVPEYLLGKKFGTYSLNFTDFNGDIFLDLEDKKMVLKRKFKFSK